MKTSLAHVMERPGMYLPSVQFDALVGFLLGFDMSGNGAPLLAFREWLVQKVGFGNNLAWPTLVLQLAFPESASPRDELAQSGNQKRAMAVLRSLLEEFWADRERPNGLRMILLGYQKWLSTQDWYGPSSPDYIDDAIWNQHYTNKAKEDSAR